MKYDINNDNKKGERKERGKKTSPKSLYTLTAYPGQRYGDDTDIIRQSL